MASESLDFMSFRRILASFPCRRGAARVYSKGSRRPDRSGRTHSHIRNGGHVTFLVGDKVIYPNHGLGVVERIEDKTILGTTCGFYHLRIIANETTVLVPIANADEVGLRPAISDDEVERLFGRLCDGKIDDHQNWKGRFK